MLLRMVATAATPRGALLAPGVALVALEGAGAGRAAFQVSVAGRTPAPPYGTVEVGTARIAAFRVPRSGADDPLLLIEDAHGEHAPLHLSDLEADPLSLTQGLAKADRARLLGFLLTFCCPAFKLGRSAEFARTCARLALDCAVDGGVATPIAQVLPDHLLAGPLPMERDASVTVIGKDRVVHSRMPILSNGVLSNGGLGSDMQLVPQADAGDLIVASGTALTVWTVEGAASLPHVLGLPEAGAYPGASARAACRRALAGSRSAAARHLLRDMELLFPAQPSHFGNPAQPLAGAVELAVPDGAGGMFIAGWLRDPLARVEAMALVTPAGPIPLSPTCLQRVRRPDIEKRFAAAAHAASHPDGFVMHVAEMPGHTLQPSLVLRLYSGAEVRLTPAARSLLPAAARDAVLGCVAPGQLTPQVMQRCLAPAAERLHRAAMALPGTPDIVRTGQARANPPVSIIVPLYRNLGFMRFQVAALAEDPRCRESEIIFVLDSPEQRGEVEHLLRGLHRLTDLPVTLVVMGRNLGYAAACNAGARAAGAPLLLLLNSDVVPPGPGWLAALMAPFARAAVSATGPKLLFDDGSIQHAGLFFERDEDGIWLNRHYHKGMPRNWGAASVRRAVPGVTGAALLVRRSLFDWVGGVCEDYVIGDYEDSDLCLRLRQAGGTILYVPEAELFHFERRSIQLHQGYARTHASLYNRLLHHGRWDTDMAAVMAGVLRTGRGRAA